MGGQGSFDHRLEWLANAEVVRLPGRHHLHMEQPGDVARVIEDFRRRHPVVTD